MYIYTYFVYTHAPACIHKPKPSIYTQHAFCNFSSGQLLRFWSTMAGTGVIYSLMTGPKSLKICSKTAMKGRGLPPSRIHHSGRNMLPTLCWTSTTTFTDQSKPRPRNLILRNQRSGLTQMTFRSAGWTWGNVYCPMDVAVLDSNNPLCHQQTEHGLW